MAIFYAKTLFNKKITFFQGNTSKYNSFNPNTEQDQYYNWL